MSIWRDNYTRNLFLRSNQKISNLNIVYLVIILSIIIFYSILVNIKDDSIEQVKITDDQKLSNNTTAISFVNKKINFSEINVNIGSKFLYDNCFNQWTEDRLIGRCFGLKTKLKVNTIEGCKEACCKLGINCITWQFWEDKKICKLGGKIRLGSEKGKSKSWCEPYAPVEWYGYKIFRNFTHINEIGERLQHQCFGLGGEKKKLSNNGSYISLSVEECSMACKNNQNCKVWQASPLRGCYYFHSDDVFCENYRGQYIGGRKCSTESCLANLIND